MITGYTIEQYNNDLENDDNEFYYTYNDPRYDSKWVSKLVFLYELDYRINNRYDNYKGIFTFNYNSAYQLSKELIKRFDIDDRFIFVVYDSIIKNLLSIKKPKIEEWQPDDQGFIFITNDVISKYKLEYENEKGEQITESELIKNITNILENEIETYNTYNTHINTYNLV